MKIDGRHLGEGVLEPQVCKRPSSNLHTQPKRTMLEVSSDGLISGRDPFRSTTYGGLLMTPTTEDVQMHVWMFRDATTSKHESPRRGTRWKVHTTDRKSCTWKLQRLYTVHFHSFPVRVTFVFYVH